MNYRKLIFLILVLAVFSSAIFSQTIVPDTKLIGLKGKVKTLETFTGRMLGPVNATEAERQPEKTTYNFDKQGNLTEKILSPIGIRHVYSFVDGFRTYKMVLDPNRMTFSLWGDPEIKGLPPIEPGEKLTEPDKRFEIKFTYEVNGNNDPTVERVYLNYGKLQQKTTFIYNEQRVLIEKIVEDSYTITSTRYKYDTKSVLIQETRTMTVKTSKNEDTVFTDYSAHKFDAKENWIERTVTVRDSVSELSVSGSEKTAHPNRKDERRTFTYYK